MSLCTVSFTAFFFFLLRQASNAHVTPEETLQRHCEGWAAKQRRESWTVPRSRGWRRHPLLMPLGDLHHPVALQFWGGEGRARPARGGGALSHKILPGKKTRRPKWIWDYIESSIFLRVLSQKERRKKKWLKKIKSNTWTRPLYSRGRQEYPQCVTYLARAAHSLAKKKESDSALKKILRVLWGWFVHLLGWRDMKSLAEMICFPPGQVITEMTGLPFELAAPAVLFSIGAIELNGLIKHNSQAHKHCSKVFIIKWYAVRTTDSLFY